MVITVILTFLFVSRPVVAATITINEEIVIKEKVKEAGASASEKPYKPVVTPKDQVKNMIRAVFGDVSDLAIAVFTAESGLRCYATNHNTNGTTDYGVAQVNSIHMAKFAGRNPLDCKANIDVAYQIYEGWGHSFAPWVAFTSGSYLKFL